jgi:uncharacterized membrane protein
MFELLFQYPARIFAKGEFVLQSALPGWVLLLAIVIAAAGLMMLFVRRSGVVRLSHGRRLTLWGIRTAIVALLLIMLWQPGIRVSALKPQQNVVAVLVDDSRSMAFSEDGKTRTEAVRETLSGGFLDKLSDKYQVRLYSFGSGISRLANLEQLTSDKTATHISSSLKAAISEAATLPVGAMVVLSDGADNAGGIDIESMAEIRRQRIPIHTIGYGREQFDRDAELTDIDIPARSLNGARLSANVSFRQRGYDRQRARIVVRSEGKVLASRDVTMRGDGSTQSETVLFAPGTPGPRTIEFSIEGLAQEENTQNNALRRLVTVESRKPRILYIEGEPRWDYKFIRRAIDGDASVELVTILRTTQNRIYRQGIQNATEVEDGFPAKVEELFAYQGLIIGGVEASYFTTAQQEAIRLFADRRGGGVLFLAGRSGLSDGGYNASSLAEILPVVLPDRKNAFKREPATVEVTAAGRESVVTRLDDAPEKNAEKWKQMPYLANYAEVGAAKPGALVLLETLPTSKGRFPLLATQNFGRGRVGVFASGGTWRWQMLQDHLDVSHATFWQQLLRWLVSDTPDQVSATTPQQVLSDRTEVPLRAEIRDKAYQPVSDATVEARIQLPDGSATTVPMALDPLTAGVYTASWTALKPGSYLAEVSAHRGSQEIGRDVFNFRREDGVAENFGIEQNRELLSKLAQETDASYYTASNASKLLDDISFSEAGLTVRETRDLWNMPIVFLLLLALAAMEWLLRRRWGIV